MRYALLLITLTVFHVCTAQYNPKEYKAYPDDKKEIVFFDDFNDSTSVWGDTMTAIKETTWGDYDFIDGKFVYTNNNSGEKGFCKNVSIDYKRNFEITISINVTGKDRAAAIFSWGRVDELLTSNYFIMVKDGKIEIFNCNKHEANGQCPGKVKKAYSPTFSDSTYNTYTIRKFESEYYIFSNGVFLTKAPYYQLTGEYICIGAGVNTTIKVDYLKIYYLP
ncbi:MAG: hypothetical protein KDC11_07950 [Chitinophagaceae bacterium]|nr:hypothetical protein [Chitinophagaceae bacterium]